jgi:hypothetical protein
MLIRLIVIFVIIYLGFKIIRYLRHLGVGSFNKVDEDKFEKIDGVMLQDPQCKVYFVKSSGVELKANGESLFFCSTQCRDDYLKTGEK